MLSEGECITMPGMDVTVDLKDVKSVNNHTPADINQLFVQSEHLVRHVAYHHDFKSDVITPEGKRYLCSLVQTTPGLVCFTLVPQSVNDGNAEVIVVFRGTRVGCPYSMARDLESPGPGCRSLYSNRNVILNAVNEAIELAKKIHHSAEVVITATGYSLGGADTQNFGAVLLNELVSFHSATDKLVYPEGTFFQYVKAVNLVMFNSAGSTKFYADMAENAVRKLRPFEIKINCYWQMVARDAVQMTGETSVLADMDPNVVTVHMNRVYFSDIPEKADLDMRSYFDQAYSAKKIHTRYCYAANAQPYRVEYYNNSSIADRVEIHRVLTKKNPYLQAWFIRGMGEWIYYLGGQSTQVVVNPVSEPFVSLKVRRNQQPRIFMPQNIFLQKEALIFAVAYLNTNYARYLSPAAGFTGYARNLVPNNGIDQKHYSGMMIENADGRKISPLTSDEKQQFSPVRYRVPHRAATKRVSPSKKTASAVAPVVVLNGPDEKTVVQHTHLPITELAVSAPLPPPPSSSTSTPALPPANTISVSSPHLSTQGSSVDFLEKWQSVIVGCFIGFTIAFVMGLAICTTGIGLIICLAIGLVIGGLGGRGVERCLSPNHDLSAPVSPAQNNHTAPQSHSTNNASLTASLGGVSNPVAVETLAVAQPVQRPLPPVSQPSLIPPASAGFKI